MAHGTNTIIEEISFSLEDGETGVLMGPNASGKTTLLKAIAGLIIPAKGKIVLDDRVLFESNDSGKKPLINVPSHLREIGYVPSDFALFDHLTVKENVFLALAKKPISNDEKIERVNKILEFMSLREHANSKPSILSSGLKQKVAIARALVANPKLLLLDEPFSSIDPVSRPLLYQELKKLLEVYGVKTIIATHNVEEAFWFKGKLLILTSKTLTHSSSLDIDKISENEYLARSLGFNVVNSLVLQTLEPGSYHVAIRDSSYHMVSARTKDLFHKGERVTIVFPNTGLTILPHCGGNTMVNELQGYIIDFVEKIFQVSLILEVSGSYIRVDVDQNEWKGLKGNLVNKCVSVVIPKELLVLMRRGNSNGYQSSH